MLDINEILLHRMRDMIGRDLSSSNNTSIVINAGTKNNDYESVIYKAPEVAITDNSSLMIEPSIYSVDHPSNSMCKSKTRNSYNLIVANPLSKDKLSLCVSLGLDDERKWLESLEMELGIPLSLSRSTYDMLDSLHDKVNEAFGIALYEKLSTTPPGSNQSTLLWRDEPDGLKVSMSATVVSIDTDEVLFYRYSDINFEEIGDSAHHDTDLVVCTSDGEIYSSHFDDYLRWKANKMKSMFDIKL